MLDRLIEEAPRFFNYYNLIFIGQAMLATLAMTFVASLALALVGRFAFRVKARVF